MLPPHRIHQLFGLRDVSIGWSPTKRKEMRLPDLRYLLVRSSVDSTSAIEAFLSFMLTYEDGHEVIYCYEIHLPPSIAAAAGKHLMRIMEEIGTRGESRGYVNRFRGE
jgi:hypothetical protein